MAEIRSTPRNRYIGAAADLIRPLTELASKYEVLPSVPLLGGTSLDELLGLQGTQSLLEDMSYGAPAVRTPAYGPRIVNMQADPRILDLVDAATLAVPVAAGTKAAGKSVLKEAARQIEQGSGLLPSLMVEPRAYVVKPEGGNWVPGSVETFLEQMKRRNPDNPPVDRWIDTALRKYLIRDLASPSDPIRKLAEEGVTLMSPGDIRDIDISTKAARDVNRMSARAKNKPEDFQVTKLAQEPVAGKWENIADAAVQPLSKYAVDAKVRPDWLEKLEDTDPLYALNDLYANWSGLPNMVDQLAEDIARGSIDPSDISGTSVEKMARRVNAARLAKEDEEATVLNDLLEPVHGYESGYTWRNLLVPDDPETTDKILKREGDVEMGNCISGYCYDELIGDDTRIYSLRDPRGKPHVNIEVKKQSTDSPVITQIFGGTNTTPKSEYWPYIQDFIRQRPDIDIQLQPGIDLPQQAGLLDMRKLGIGLQTSDAIDPVTRRHLLGEIDRIYPVETDPVTNSRILSGQYGTRRDIEDLISDIFTGYEGPRYVTPDEFLGNLRGVEPRSIEAGYRKRGYAEGGEVDWLDELIGMEPQNG